MGLGLSRAFLSCWRRPDVIEATDTVKERRTSVVEPNTSAVALLLNDTSQDVQEIKESSSSVRQVAPVFSLPHTLPLDEAQDREDYLNFIIFTDRDTIDYIQKSKVSMFSSVRIHY